MQNSESAIAEQAKKNESDGSDTQTISLEEYRVDPAKAVQATLRGPVEVIDLKTGKRAMYLSRPMGEQETAAE